MRIKITIDSESIKIKPFVSKIVGNTIMAAVNSLDLPRSDWKTLEVKITK